MCIWWPSCGQRSRVYLRPLRVQSLVCGHALPALLRLSLYRSCQVHPAQPGGPTSYYKLSPRFQVRIRQVLSCPPSPSLLLSFTLVIFPVSASPRKLHLHACAVFVHLCSGGVHLRGRLLNHDRRLPFLNRIACRSQQGHPSLERICIPSFKSVLAAFKVAKAFPFVVQRYHPSTVFLVVLDEGGFLLRALRGASFFSIHQKKQSSPFSYPLRLNVVIPLPRALSPWARVTPLETYPRSGLHWRKGPSLVSSLSRLIVSQLLLFPAYLPTRSVFGKDGYYIHYHQPRHSCSGRKAD